MPVTANINLSVSGQHTSVLDLGTAVLPFSLSAVQDYTNGTATGQVDRVFTDTRTLTASATENLDLAGALVDAFGATLTFVTIKAVIIKAALANANDVLVSRGATNGVALFTAVSAGLAGLKPGGAFAWFAGGAGLAVTPATGDLIVITNSAGGTSVNYDVIILGTSA